MRLHVTTVGDDPWHHAQRDVFARLAAIDAVGEHALDDDPERADAVLVVDLHQHPGDPFLGVLRSHSLVRAQASKLFVYDERDLPFFTFAGIYVSGTPGRRRPMLGGPYPELPNAAAPVARVPDLLFAFVGARTHRVRDAILALQHERALVEDSGPVDFLSGGGGSEGRARYAEVMARAKFVLCPRGHGPSSFRLYETLSAGRVPVVISDGWLAPPRVDWARCAVRVAERDVPTLPRVLERLEPAWEEMAAAGREAFAEHFAPQRLWHHYAASIAGLRGAARGGAQAGVVRGAAPAWAQAGMARGVAPWWAQGAVPRIAVRQMRAVARRTWR